jgi:hypothetical protein
MKKVTVLNELTNRIIVHELKDDFYEFFIQDRTEKGKFGLVARWLPLDQATSFELSREDDRREVEIQAEIPEYLDEENVLHPATPAVYRTEIHVPDDFTVTITDITEQHEKELEKRKLKRKKELADEIIIHINYVIRNLTKQDKIILLGRSDIRMAYEFLGKGSIVDTRDLIATLPVDSLLTQEMKDSVYDFSTEKVNEYNAIIWT